MNPTWPGTIKRLGLVFTLATMAAEATAEPDKEQYELQERCGKRAEQVFKSDNPRQSGGSIITNTDDGQDITSYQNHYSATLNKCFYLLTYVSVKHMKNPPYIATLMTLYDINENKQYGQFFKRSDVAGPTGCYVQQKRCQSESEWQELLKPYMEQ